MAVPPISEEAARLLSTAIESVERLELLLALRRAPSKTFTAKALRASMPSGGAGLDTHLAILCGRGFLGVTIGNDLVYAYKPISARIEQHVNEIADLWEKRPSDVRALLAGRREPDPLRAFADAFRFKKGSNDDG